MLLLVLAPGCEKVRSLSGLQPASAPEPPAVPVALGPWLLEPLPGQVTVAWTTLPSSNVVLSGEARFAPLSTKACLMLYRLVMELPIVDDTLHGELDRHPASLVVAEFREHLRRLC